MVDYRNSFLDKPFSGTPLPYWWNMNAFLRAEENTTLKARSYPIGLFITKNGNFRYNLTMLPIAYPLRILISGPSGSGKSVLSRVIEECFLMDYVDHQMPHPILVIDFKGSFEGFGTKNTKPSHIKRLHKFITPSVEKTLLKKLTWDFPKRVFVPPYAIPEQDIYDFNGLAELKEEYGVTNVYKINWRSVCDLKYLGKLFGIEGDRKWYAQLNDVFNKCVANRKLTLDDVIEKGGYLEDAISNIVHSASVTASKEFLEQWRSKKYLFSETDTFADCLDNEFSYNVLTFKPTYTSQTQNQIAFCLALEGIVRKMQTIKKKTIPLIILSDVLFSAGKGSVSQADSVRAITELLNGFGRSSKCGFAIVLEVQDIGELPESLRPRQNRYSHHFDLNPFISDQKTRGMVKIDVGKGVVDDSVANLIKEVIYLRPPLTSFD